MADITVKHKTGVDVYKDIKDCDVKALLNVFRDKYDDSYYISVEGIKAEIRFNYNKL